MCHSKSGCRSKILNTTALNYNVRMDCNTTKFTQSSFIEVLLDGRGDILGKWLFSRTLVVKYGELHTKDGFLEELYHSTTTTK